MNSEMKFSNSLVCPKVQLSWTLTKAMKVQYFNLFIVDVNPSTIDHERMGCFQKLRLKLAN